MVGFGGGEYGPASNRADAALGDDSPKVDSGTSPQGARLRVNNPWGFCPPTLRVLGPRCPLGNCSGPVVPGAQLGPFAPVVGVPGGPDFPPPPRLTKGPGSPLAPVRMLGLASAFEDRWRFGRWPKCPGPVVVQTSQLSSLPPPIRSG